VVAELVLEDWGFARRLAGDSGLNALFAGPPGTGKTMSAGVVATELGLDLYRIDLSTVVSKYVGETEKNLGRIFDAAAATDAVLLFDEADALFGRRTEIRDAHDRYANLEVGYLLSRMEDHEGIVILATNVRKNLDDAFVRRMRFIVEFPLPGPRERLRLWETVWPDAVPRADGLDLPALAQRFELTGAGIRNAALAAAFRAAADGRPVERAHVLHGIRGEFLKAGTLVAGLELAHPPERVAVASAPEA